MKRIAPFENQHSKRPCLHTVVKEGPISCLPLDLVHACISYLDHPTKQASFEVNKLWNKVTYEEEKLVELKEFHFFLETVLENLEPKFETQRHALLEILNESKAMKLIPPVFPVGYESVQATRDKINAKIQECIPLLEEVFRSLPPEERDSVLFDPFIGKIKPQLFYKFCTLSDKYYVLEETMLECLRIPDAHAKVFQLLKEGAVVAHITLANAIYYGVSVELMTALLGSIFPLLDLNLIIQHAVTGDATSEILDLLLNTGVTLSEDVLITAMNADCSCEHFKTLLIHAPESSRSNILEKMVKDGRREKKITACLEAGAIPSSDALNRAIFVEYSDELILNIIDAMLREKVEFNPTLLSAALFRRKSKDVICALLKAGQEVTEAILQEARRSHISPEALAAIEESYLQNNGAEK